MPAPLSDVRRERLVALATSTFGHRCLWGMCRGMQALLPGSKACGTAVTLALPGPDSALLHEVMRELRAGDLLMIDRLGDKAYACIGGVVARALRDIGIAGVVIDGPVTDIVELRRLGLPVWSTGGAALTTRRLGLGGRFNAPVSVGGCAILPGDAVLADDDGVFVLPVAGADDAIAWAEAREAWERGLQDLLKQGINLPDALIRHGNPIL
jgi:regulator of RNase E activity RraA